MATLRERLQVLLPRDLKDYLTEAAKRKAVSVGEYVRSLVEADRRETQRAGDAVAFPFGQRPIRTGRTTGSVDHDRLGD